MRVDGGHHHHDTLLGEDPSVPEHTVADVAHGAVDVEEPGRHRIAPVHPGVVEDHGVAVLAQQGLVLVDAHACGQLHVVHEVPPLRRREALAFAAPRDEPQGAQQADEQEGRKNEEADVGREPDRRDDARARQADLLRQLGEHRVQGLPVQRLCRPVLRIEERQLGTQQTDARRARSQADRHFRR